jgi:RNA-directed DNA polymerase
VKSHGGLFARIVEVENLRLAMQAAARGKRDRVTVARFLSEAGDELPRLRDELDGGRYVPRRYRQFRVCDPKPRTISCAEFRDRVVHHAVCDVIGPLIERRFLFDTYACRKGKGTHRATARAQELARQRAYFLKLDVASFLDSVDHGILLGLLARQFREPRLLALLETLVSAPMAGAPPGKGLPIGNLTSQWFANLYLDGVDHLVKETVRVPGYVRYMDDMLLFADSKVALWAAHDALVRFLADERRLVLKAPATRLAPCTEGIPFLGMRVFPGTWRLQSGRFLRTRRRMRGKERACLEGRLSEERLARSAAAAQGMLSWYGMKGVLPQGMEV